MTRAKDLQVWLQGGKEALDALSLLVSFRKRALQLVAQLEENTCSF